MSKYRVLLAGAGAETDLGLPSGPNYTLDTFFTQKTSLYEALSDFYSSRLNSASRKKPGQYQSHFLFSATGSSFKELLRRIESVDSSCIPNLCRVSCPKVEEYSGVDLKTVFKALISEDGSARKTILDIVPDAIPPESYYGILESYFSEILNPREHVVRFWKLVNFYWSAFFSVLLPIADSLYSDSPEYRIDRYRFVLTRLNQVVKTIFDRTTVRKLIDGRECYYSVLRNKFSSVVTTNYTPFAQYLVDFQEDRIAYLSGSLSMFEYPETLTVSNISSSDKRVGDTDFVFPFLMTQAPVKPIIETNQVKQFGKAIAFLEEADEITVLGYSFCEQDAHIASIVAEQMRLHPKKRMTYCWYRKSDDEVSESDAKRYLADHLRLSFDVVSSQITVRFIGGRSDPAFTETEFQ